MSETESKGSELGEGEGSKPAKIELEAATPKTVGAVFEGLAALDAGLEPEEATRSYFQKILKRANKLIGTRRLMLFEGQAGGREPNLLAWSGLRPGPNERAWPLVAQAALVQSSPALFYPEAALFSQAGLELPKTPLVAGPVRAYGKRLAMLVAALPVTADPQALVFLAEHLGLHLYSRQAHIKAGGLQTRATQNQRRLEALFEAMPLAALLVDGSLVRANGAAATLLGLSEGAGGPISLDRLAFFKAGVAWSLGQYLETAATGLSEQVVLRRQDEQTSALLISSIPVLDEGRGTTAAFVFLKPA